MDAIDETFFKGDLSLIEYEREFMKQRLQLLWKLRDPIIYREFTDFMTFSKSTRFLFILNILFLCSALIPTIGLGVGSQPLRDYLFIFEIFLIAVMFLSGWGLYITLKLPTRPPELHKTFIEKFQTVFYFSTLILHCIILIHRTLDGECRHPFSYLRSWSCNPNSESSTIPIDSSLMVMAIPIIFSTVLREARILILISGWIIAILGLVYCCYHQQSAHLVGSTVIYAILSLVITFDSFKQYFFFYIISYKLRETMKINKRLSEQATAIEMRHMIANVAHDLKTPLSSFMTGVEIIANDIKDCEERVFLGQCSRDCVSKTLQGLKSTIHNIKDTNTFMLMTINRCLDYTKASNGLKLNPKYETIDLRETLQLPLNCMRNVQSKINIVLKPYSDEICTHIITDKQWLQENILCLLSNAVKYSAGGEAIITVRLINGDDESVQKSLMSLQIGDEIDARSIRLRARSLEHDANDLLSKALSLTTKFKRRASHFFNASVSKKILVEPPTPDISEKDRTIEEALQHIPSHSGKDEVLLFQVADTGIGMSDEAMQSLFNPFKQTQRLAGGTGLGLYSLAKRVEALKGQYGVQRREDGHKGSVFWFTIPYKPDHLSAHLWELNHFSAKYILEKNPLPATAAPAPPLPENPDGENSFSVLIAEDTPSIAKMTTVMLKKQGHKAVVAENGQVLLDLYFDSINKTTGQSPYDVILMDLQMPVMDGLEATKRIRMNEQVLSDLLGKPIHQLVIGVSANSDHETVEEGLRIGIDDFLPKPFSVPAFMEKVKDFKTQMAHGYVC